MAIQRVGVIGAGTMGNGIAHVLARRGFNVVLCDVEQRFLDRGLATVAKNLDRELARNKITADDKAATLQRITAVLDRAQLADCDLAIEAATERFEIKAEIFRDLDRLMKPDVILASNTSSISISKIGALTRRADKVIGMHFFNPVPVMKLVEVVRTVTTSPESFDRAYAFAARLGKEPIAAKDNSGFVVNLLLVPYLLDAIRGLEHGVASAPDIDKAMQLGCGYPMGPFVLLDFVGLDTTYKIAEIMFAEYREPRYAPPPLLKRMVLAGYYGKKSGRGFYDYGTTPPTPCNLGL